MYYTIASYQHEDMKFCCHSGQAMRQVRHGSTAPQDFHSKYGTGLLISGATFCTAVWAYVSVITLEVFHFPLKKQYLLQ